MIKAGKNKIILKELDTDELKCEGGIFLYPNQSSEATVKRYEVISIGNNQYEVEEGDVVLCLDIGLISIKTPENKYLVTNYKNILAKIIK